MVLTPRAGTPSSTTVEELEHLYTSLTRGERDELPQELLVAAPHGGEALAAVIDVWLVDQAGRELLENLAGTPTGEE
jgi:hypothetical protein